MTVFLNWPENEELRDPNSRHIFITGASGGIGQAIARRFASEGNKLSLLAHRHPERLNALVQDLEAVACEYRIFQADISLRSSLAAVIEEASLAFGPVDVLVNSAGIAQQKLFTDITETDWQQMLGIHLTGTFNTCQLVTPAMIRRRYGRIINISSMWGETGASMEVHYSAVKAGIIGFTKALAKELGPSAITVNCVTPGVIETEMNAELSLDVLGILQDETPLGRHGQPMDVAAAVYFLASDEASFITGTVLDVNGGYLI